MNPLTSEWVAKAEGDWNALNQLLRVRKNPNYDLICFECQQCAEKYLKARLVEAAIAFPKTHDLVVLLDLALPVEPLWDFLRPDLRELKNYAVRFRYIDDAADRDEARKAKSLCRLVRNTVRPALGLSL